MLSKSFQFYIVDLIDGVVKGTNSTETADNYSESEDFFVIKPATNTWVIAAGTGDQQIPSLEEDSSNA